MSIEILEANEPLRQKLVNPHRDTRIYIDTENYISDGKYSIYLQIEPEAITPRRNYLLEHSKRYDVILTFDSVVLEHCSNAVFFMFYTETWIPEDCYNNIDIEKKKFAISTLVGGKRITYGHEVRLHLYFSQEQFTSLPITFFRSCAHPLLPAIGQNPFLESKEISAKVLLFETFQFHLAIENSRQENYFTEKLMDCLITKTIPIYYGCPNIHSYFDTTGWILLESGTPEELLEKCKVLDESYYSRYTPVIESNYKKALVYKENIARLNSTLRTLDGFRRESL
jgi:hypothetical protein